MCGALHRQSSSDFQIGVLPTAVTGLRNTFIPLTTTMPRKIPTSTTIFASIVSEKSRDPWLVHSFTPRAQQDSCRPGLYPAQSYGVSISGCISIHAIILAIQISNDCMNGQPYL